MKKYVYILLFLFLSWCSGFYDQDKDIYNWVNGISWNVQSMQLPLDKNLDIKVNTEPKSSDSFKNISSFIDSDSVLHYKWLYSVYIPSSLIDPTYFNTGLNKLGGLIDLDVNGTAGLSDFNNWDTMIFDRKENIDLSMNISDKEKCINLINKLWYSWVNWASQSKKWQEVFVMKSSLTQWWFNRYNTDVCFIEGNYTYDIRFITKNIKNKNINKILNSFEFIKK